MPEHRPADEWSKRPIYAGVLIGGASTRMGQSKALLRCGGITFVERVVAAVRERVERVVLLGNGPVPGTLAGVMRLPDVPGLAGPLAGMLAALRGSRDACWLIAACDLPMLRSEAIDWLLQQRRPDRWAVLPRTGPGLVEPLGAVYEPESLELLEELVARGFQSPCRLDGQPHVYSPPPPPDLHICWTNINTPVELGRLLAEGSHPGGGRQR